MADAEVLVVGGGPVGLATAIEARLAGLDVLVAEPRTGSIDKACGEGLMPGALRALARLGVDPPGAAFTGIAYRDEHGEVVHRFAGGPGRGVRRTVLHTALRARAEALGARFATRRIGSLATTRDAVEADGIRAGWVVGADGLHSTVARLAGLALPAPRARRRYGQRVHYAMEPWSDCVEVVWTPLGELYVTPLGHDLVGVAALARRGARYVDVLAASRYLMARLAGAEPVTELRGAGPFRQRTRTRAAGRVLLAGDASGYVDALTGEGLRIGFAQARAAIAAIRAGAPERYEREWDAVTRDARRLTSALVRVAASPLRGAVVPVARRLPGLFAAGVESLAR